MYYCQQWMLEPKEVFLVYSSDWCHTSFLNEFMSILKRRMPVYISNIIFPQLFYKLPSA